MVLTQIPFSGRQDISVFNFHIIGVEDQDNFHGKALGDKGKAAVEILKSKITTEGPHGLGPQPVDDVVAKVDLSGVKLSSPPSYTIGEKVIKAKNEKKNVYI